jgi:hypothetical protein
MAEYTINPPWVFAQPGFKPGLSCPICCANLPPLDEDGKSFCSVCGTMHEDASQKRPSSVPYIVGVDLGKLRDPSAFVAYKTSAVGEQTAYSAVALERFDKGTPYPKIRKTIASWVSREPLDEAPLVVDATGVGGPVVDEMQEMPELRGRIVPVTITQGLAISWDKTTKMWHVAKRHLASVIQATLSSGRLIIPPADESWTPQEKGSWTRIIKVLEEEFKNFTIKITTHGNETMSAWRDNVDNDDILMATATCLWWSEYRQLAQAVSFASGAPTISPDAFSLPGMTDPRTIRI